MAQVRFLEGMPGDLVARLNALAVPTDQAMLAGRWDDAVQGALVVHGLILDAQRPGHRYHKGAPLQQAAVALLNLGRFDEARTYALQAFVEDVLSRGEESPNNLDELSRPAAFTLLFTFGIPGTTLLDLLRRLRQRQSGGVLWQDPAKALEDEPLDRHLDANQPETPRERREVAQAAAQVEVTPERVPQWRVPGLFGTQFEDRVFIGGVYRGQYLGALVAIRDEVRRNGFDGVLAAEFKRRDATDLTNYEDALLLLRACHRAIFDVSDDRGQLQEFQMVDHYSIKDVLVVHNVATNDISAMVTGKCKAIGVTPVPFTGPEDLRLIVARWLATFAGSPRDAAGVDGSSEATPAP
jgi:hypothetical protein